MANYTILPTANQTPDATLGGAAMTSPTNTGHASSTASGSGGSSQVKSIRWSGFPSFPSSATSITLKFDHTSSGALSGAGAGNEFFVDYSVNGGGSWTTAVSRSSFTASEGPTTVSVSLPVTQNTSQVQVREAIEGSTLDVGESASATSTISNVKIEIVSNDGGGLITMS